MTLVIAFIGKNGAVMTGDLREITFEGDKQDREKLAVAEAETASASTATSSAAARRGNSHGRRTRRKSQKIRGRHNGHGLQKQNL